MTNDIKNLESENEREKLLHQKELQNLENNLSSKEIFLQKLQEEHETLYHDNLSLQQQLKHVEFEFSEQV